MRNVPATHKSIMTSTVRNKSRNRQIAVGLLWSAPYLLGMFVFLLLPFGVLLKQSFAVRGISNYLQVYRSPAFGNAMKNSLILLLASLVLMQLLSFLLALFLSSLKEQGKLLLGAGILPYLIPALGGVMLVRAVLPDSVWSLLVIYLWKYVGFFALLMFGTMKKVPVDHYEAARLEGAGYWQQVKHVTMPCIRKMQGFSLILSVVYSFLVYREALLLGGTHPGGSLYLLQHYISNNFENLNYMHLSVAAVTIVGMTAAAVGMAALEKRWRYGR